MISDEEVDVLREIADRIRCSAEDTSYGYPCVADPRDFHPDPEVCSEAEVEAHRSACDAWNAGNPVERAPTHVPLEGGCGHITQAPWGMGVSTFQDPELLKLAQDLDDIIDRIRQVAT